MSAPRPLFAGALMLALAALALGLRPDASPALASQPADCEETSFASLLNGYRTANGKSALTFYQLAHDAAQFLSQNNSDRGSLSTTDIHGHNTIGRYADFGVTITSYFVTVPYGHETGTGLWSYWQNDPILQDYILDTKWNAIGVGRVYDADNYGWMWTVDLVKVTSIPNSSTVSCSGGNPTATPTATPKPPTPTPTATGVPPSTSATPTTWASPTPTKTPGPSGMPTPVASVEPTPVPTPTPTPTPTATPTPTPTAEPTPSGGPALRGDADCDGSVGSADALEVLREVAGFEEKPGCLAQADTDCDGDRDALDALGILRYTVSLPVRQPAGCSPVGVAAA